MTKHVRIEGPDSTRQWRVVLVSNGDVLMDGFEKPQYAVWWAQARGYAIASATNPYWLQGSGRTFFVTPAARMSAKQKDVALTMIGHVEHEDEQDARKRRKQTKAEKRAALSKRMASIARRPRTMLRRIVELGGIGRGSFKNYPGDKTAVRDAKVRGLVTVRGRPWDYMAQAMVEEGYIPSTSEDPLEAFVDLLDESLSGRDVYAAHDYGYVERREAKAQQRAEREQRAAERAEPRELARNRMRKKKRKKNPQLLTLGNPRRVPDSELEEAFAAYRKFHGVDPSPDRVHRGGGAGVLIGLGEIKRVDYGPKRGKRKGPIWFHHFKPGCVLCTSADGRRLVILDPKGKRLVDFARGIIR